MRTALIAGATGLVGSSVLELLLSNDQYTKVIAITRHALEPHPKLYNITTEFSLLDQYKDLLVADDIFCCLGTTIKVAKSKEAFRKVDFDYPLSLAKIGKENGAKQYLLVSSLGANKNSGIFYSKVKGETEEAISKVGFDGLFIMRPSMLLGPRKEHRPTEEAAKKVYKFLNFIIPKKYKAIESATVAKAMISIALENKKGEFVYESSELQTYS